MHKGFSLVELLIVIAIIGILAISSFAAYTNSIRTSRDARRKADLQNIQKALETYYEDNTSYPATLDLLAPTYMATIPTDSVSTAMYRYVNVFGQGYYLYSCIENTNDTGPGVNQSGYAGTDCGCGSTPVADRCRFGLSSSNITLP